MIVYVYDDGSLLVEFKIGDIVEVTQEMTILGKKLTKGTIGKITNVKQSAGSRFHHYELKTEYGRNVFYPVWAWSLCPIGVRSILEVYKLPLDTEFIKMY